MSFYISEHERIGVSGIMRVKNDAQFVQQSIDSCIDALDELIIVYNDCTDNSAALILEKQRQYPDKIKVYEYKYKVYSINLSKMEYEFAKKLPPDSPQLLCNYYNYALSKVSYKYAMKIDADQLYFSKKIQSTCDIVREAEKMKFNFRVIFGLVFFLIYRITSKVCTFFNIVLPIYSRLNANKFYPYYMEFVKYMIKKDKCVLSLSGLNVYVENDEISVPLGLKNECLNILPPMNGVGDHLIFKVSSKTYYEPFDDSFYSMMRSERYTLIEKFVYPACALLPIGIMWFHLNMMRPNLYEKVKFIKQKHPNSFISFDEFTKGPFSKIQKRIDTCMVSQAHLLYFQWLYSITSRKVNDCKTFVSFTK